MSDFAFNINFVFIVFLPVGLFFLSMISFIIGILLKLLKSIKYKKWNKIGTICFTISMIIYFLFIVSSLVSSLIDS
jgi:hypothetical protein